ncbi:MULTISPECIES: hypothetical protein [Mycobacterium]|uniref:hypothetical protein n=1 Tax=Mycobacterium TaxID=1763 RepID=UPI000A8D751A|nr:MULTISPECIES: hypothetical protein [Mycobacterium]MDA3660181.1 hypothetical protein [Mycobacterium xenopi]
MRSTITAAQHPTGVGVVVAGAGAITSDGNTDVVMGIVASDRAGSDPITRMLGG